MTTATGMAPGPESPDEQERTRCEAEYEKHEQQAWTDAQSSSDDFDKSLLTYSSGALGLSIAFLKDVVAKTHPPINLLILVSSWIAFALCILITIVSFRLSIEAQYAQLEIKRLTIFKGEAYRRCWQSKCITFCSYSALVTFVVGLVLTLVFAITNLS